MRRAEQAGQSLQQFLAAQLAVIAATPTIDEILDRIERREKGRLSAEAAIDAIDEERPRPGDLGQMEMNSTRHLTPGALVNRASAVTRAQSRCSASATYAASYAVTLARSS